MNKPIIPWVGGKRRLAKQILPLFPKHTCYVEPFAGGAALFFMKEPSKTEVLNDLNGELTNLYRVVQHHLEEFVKQFRWALVSREIFKLLDITPVETLTDIQRAARFFYLQKVAFAAKSTNRSYGYSTTTAPKLNLLRIEEDLSQGHLRLSRANIENLDWRKCIKKYDRTHTLFYLDPPYLGLDYLYGSKMPLKDFEEMADILSNIKGKAIISVSSVKEMRKIFKGFKIKQAPITYSFYGGNKSKKVNELIIKSW